ncbi:hypothetical protein [Reyranella sp.]|jgi:hypothetical protein|uniref:hypothetical protein n=1 Tax=Reyranella sp. TaxID=1929291 RepID=UPI002F958A91
MKRLVIPLLAPILTQPASTFAHSEDAAYCATLSALANRYIVSSTGEGRGAPDLETRAAIYDCDKGNTAAGIPVLERKLRNNGFTLPKRS